MKESSGRIASVDEWQSKYAPMPDYTKRAVPLGQAVPEGEEEGQEAGSEWPALDGWGSLAGVLGTAVTLAVVYLASVLLRRRGKVAGASRA